MLFPEREGMHSQGVVFAFLTAKEQVTRPNSFTAKSHCQNTACNDRHCSPVARRVKRAFNWVVEESHTQSKLPLAIWVDFYFSGSSICVRKNQQLA